MQPSAIPPRTSSASFANGHPQPQHHGHHGHPHHSWSAASASGSGSGPATPRHRSTISTASGDWRSQPSPPPPPGPSCPTRASAHFHHHLHRHASPRSDSLLRPPPTAPSPDRSETAAGPGKMTAEPEQPPQLPQPQDHRPQGRENENETEPKSKIMGGERAGREQEEEAEPEGEPAEPEAGRAPPPPPPQPPSPPHPQHHHHHHHHHQPQNQNHPPPPPHHRTQPPHPGPGPGPDPDPDPGRFRTLDLDLAHRPGGWTDEKERALRGPYDYLHDKPGKDFRTQLINAFDAWLEVPPRSLAVITRVVGMLHTASLLVDDVEDSSSLRRGLPVAHSIFGVAQTINSSNYMYFRALGELGSLRPGGAAVAIFADELVNLHRGQGMDLFWRDTLACPSEDDYLEMVDNKTGGLLRLGIKLMQDEAGAAARQAGRPAGPDCVPLGNLIGLIYQIRDDYMNLSSADYTTNKGLCEDLTEGKFSFPIIHAIRADRANTQLVNILRQKPTDADVKRYAVAYMDRVGSFEYTRRVLRVLVDRARALTDQIDGGRGRAAGVHRILDTISV